MSRGDFKIKSDPKNLFTIENVVVPAGTANSINEGEPTRVASATGVAGTGVELMADAEPTTADAKRFAGLAKTQSTDTAAATGRVTLFAPLPGIIYSGKPKVAGAVNTQSELDALLFKRVIFDLTASVWTIDTAATDAAANGIVIVGGDLNADIAYFMVSPGVALFNTQN